MEYLTGGQAAKLLGVSRQSIRMWARAGKIVPALVIGKQPFYTLNEVARVAAARGISLNTSSRRAA